MFWSSPKHTHTHTCGHPNTHTLTHTYKHMRANTHMHKHTHHVRPHHQARNLPGGQGVITSSILETGKVYSEEPGNYCLYVAFHHSATQFLILWLDTTAAKYALVCARSPLALCTLSFSLWHLLRRGSYIHSTPMCKYLEHFKRVKGHEHFMIVLLCCYVTSVLLVMRYCVKIVLYQVMQCSFG